jgi:hypothetical protein
MAKFEKLPVTWWRSLTVFSTVKTRCRYRINPVARERFYNDFWTILIFKPKQLT